VLPYQNALDEDVLITYHNGVHPFNREELAGALFRTSIMEIYSGPSVSG
jgi:hypothetical protein